MLVFAVPRPLQGLAKMAILCPFFLSRVSRSNELYTAQSASTHGAHKNTRRLIGDEKMKEKTGRRCTTCRYMSYFTRSFVERCRWTDFTVEVQEEHANYPGPEFLPNRGRGRDGWRCQDTTSPRQSLLSSLALWMVERNNCFVSLVCKMVGAAVASGEAVIASRCFFGRPCT